MAKKIGTCKLCGQDNIKFAKSHVIPKSLWGEVLKNKSGLAQIVSWKDNEPNRRSPVGEYDQEILCIPCEENLSPWDNYANDIFMQNLPLPLVDPEGEQYAWICNNIEFFKLKMFFLSLIWRMHASNRQMFKMVDIGPYFPRLTKALVKQDPKIFPELDIVITRFNHKLADGIMSPVKHRWDGVNGYNIHFSQHTCWVKVDKRPVPGLFGEIAVSSGEPLQMFFFDYRESPELRAKVEIARKKLLKHRRH